MTVLKKRKQNYSTKVITVIVSYSSFPSFYKLFQTYQLHFKYVREEEKYIRGSTKAPHITKSS